jgi:hypothetical protein
MEFTLLQLKEIEPSLMKFINSVLPAKTNFRLIRFSTALTRAMGDLEEARVKLVENMGTAQKEGGFKVEGKKENEEFDREWNKLLEEKIDLEVRPVPLSELSGVSMTPRDFAALAFIIEDDYLPEPKKSAKSKKG